MRELLIAVAMTASSMIAAEHANGDPEAASLKWQRFEIPEVGTSVDYPARIFSPSGQSKKGLGRKFDSPDGRTVLSIYSQENVNVIRLRVI
jgi:hypothetical protein